MVTSKKEIELVVNLDTSEVRGEAFNYEGEGCSLDLNALLGGVEVTKRTTKTPAKKQVLVRTQKT